jgi:hypothetical protein
MLPRTVGQLESNPDGESAGIGLGDGASAGTGLGNGASAGVE